MINYTNLSWIGEDQSLLHAIDLIIDDKNYGTQLIPIESDIGKKLIEFIQENNLILPIEETGEHETELTDALLYDLIRDNVQLMLDRKAQEKNYDNGFALSTYINSTILSFKEEAHKYVAWRDQCWVVCYGLLDKYQKGEIERPTVDEVMDQMPKLDWSPK